MSIPTIFSEKLTVDDSVTIFDADIYNKVKSQINEALDGCTVSIEDADVRYLYKADPVADTGVLLKAGTVFTFNTEEEVRGVRFIRTGAVSAVLNVIYNSNNGA